MVIMLLIVKSSLSSEDSTLMLTKRLLMMNLLRLSDLKALLWEKVMLHLFQDMKKKRKTVPLDKAMLQG